MRDSESPGRKKEREGVQKKYGRNSSEERTRKDKVLSEDAQIAQIALRLRYKGNPKKQQQIKKGTEHWRKEYETKYQDIFDPNTSKNRIEID